MSEHVEQRAAPAPSTSRPAQGSASTRWIALVFVASVLTMYAIVGYGVYLAIDFLV